MIHPSIAILKSYFRIAQIEAVFVRSPIKDLSAVQRRSQSEVLSLAIKSENQSALTLSQSRSIGLKSGE